MREAKGFSLLEVLVALVFLAVGLLALAGLHVTSLRGNTLQSSPDPGNGCSAGSSRISEEPASEFESASSESIR